MCRGECIIFISISYHVWQVLLELTRFFCFCFLKMNIFHLNNTCWLHVMFVLWEAIRTWIEFKWFLQFLFKSSLLRNHYSHVDLEIKMHVPTGGSSTNGCLQYWSNTLSGVIHWYLEIDPRTYKALSNILLFRSPIGKILRHGFERYIGHIFAAFRQLSVRSSSPNPYIIPKVIISMTSIQFPLWCHPPLVAKLINIRMFAETILIEWLLYAQILYD